MAPTTKVYTVNTAFVLDGMSYEAGQKYELSVDAVATLAEGTVTEFVSDTNPADTPSTDPGTGVAAEATPAVPWVGNHKIQG